MMNKRLKQGSTFLLAVALTFPLLTLPGAKAANAIDTDKECSIQFDIGGSSELPNDGVTVQVNLYKVASVDESGNYTVTDAFTGLKLSSVSADNLDTAAATWAERAGLLHDIGKVPDDEPELPHAILGMKLCEKYKEKPDICNAVGAHHDEVEMQTLLAPIVQVCDAISGARPGARREIVEAYIKRLNDLEQLALSYPGVVKTYAIQAGRELRVIVGADKIDDKDTENLSTEIAKRIQDEMTYPGQVKITVIRETRAVSYAK